MYGSPLTPMVKVLLILNIGIFILANLIGFDQVFDFMALRFYTASEFQIHQILTHMFMHANVGHLISNMFALFMFGPWLEKIWGAKRFLSYYLICGLGASLLYTLVNAYSFYKISEKISAYNQDPNPYSYELIINKDFGSFKYIGDFGTYYSELPYAFEKNPKDPELIKETKEVLNGFYHLKLNIPMVGASGAIFGILIGFGMLFPNTVLMLLFPPIPVKAKYLVGFYALFEIYAGIHKTPGDTVAHFAHIGGMLIGAIIIVYWKRKRDRFY